MKLGVNLVPRKLAWTIYVAVIAAILVGNSYVASTQLFYHAKPTSSLASVSTDVVKADPGSVQFIVPDTNTSRPKPLGTQSPSEEDFAFYIIASGIVLGMTKNRQGSTTDTTVVDQTGNPRFKGTLVLIGNSLVDAATRYYETSGQGYVRFGQDSTSFYIQNSTGTVIPSSAMSKQQLVRTSDIFVIQLFTDNENRKVLEVWGYTGRGAAAGANFLKFQILADPDKYNSAYYIGKWVDATSGSSMNGLPDAGDTYQILATGPTTTVPAPVFSQDQIIALYIVAFVLAGLGYAIHRRWLEFEIKIDRGPVKTGSLGSRWAYIK